MQKLLAFPSKTQDSKLSFSMNFLAVQLLPPGTGVGLDIWQSLSPQVMRWRADLWLIDLSSCANYWQAQAQAKQLHKESFLQHKLDELIGSELYRAVLAQDPWQALLLLPCLQQQSLRGVIARSSRMSENLWPSLRWDDWWEACVLYAEHSDDKRLQAELSKRRASMQLAMRRLGCSSPAQFKNLPSAQINRRFGTLISKLWTMTWQPASTSTRQLLESWHTVDFPWRDQPSEKPLSRRRVLDHPLREWESIETYLREDLNHFCLLSSFKKGERILAMEWKIVLYNLQEICVSVLFRHPHSLHQDLPEQRTALLQIFYALQKKIREQRIQDPEDPGFWILSWELCLNQKLRLAARPQLLFADETEHHWQELLSLENQLPQALEAYTLNDDWVPEDSIHSATQETIEDPLSEASKSLWELGRSRPLYMQRRAYPLPRMDHSLLWKFRERIMEKWWQKTAPTSVRDYYEVLCDDQLLWVARNPSGDCTVQGIYG